jgi:hypothetical protein|tara:strand:- start:134 stop:253 length:120 start_codon:yes stop_codon:yes gene_type:complete
MLVVVAVEEDHLAKVEYVVLLVDLVVVVLVVMDLLQLLV